MSSLKTSGGVGCGGKMSGEVCIFSANIHLDAVSRTATFQVSHLSMRMEMETEKARFLDVVSSIYMDRNLALSHIVLCLTYTE